MTKYFVKTNSDCWVISKVLIVKTVMAQIGHDMELSFSFSPGVCRIVRNKTYNYLVLQKLKSAWVKTEKVSTFKLISAPLLAY